MFPCGSKLHDTFEIQTCLNTCAYTCEAILSCVKKKGALLCKEAKRKKKREAALCTIWNRVFSSEFLLEGVMKNLLPSSLLIFPFTVLLLSASESVGV